MNTSGHTSVTARAVSDHAVELGLDRVLTGQVTVFRAVAVVTRHIEFERADPVVNHVMKDRVPENGAVWFGRHAQPAGSPSVPTSVRCHTFLDRRVIPAGPRRVGWWKNHNPNSAPMSSRRFSNGVGAVWEPVGVEPLQVGEVVLPSDVDEVVVHRDPVSAKPIQHIYAVQHHLFGYVISGVMRVSCSRR